MADVMSTEKRSSLMSRIKGKNTRPEMLVRQGLWRAGLRYRLHDRRLPGRPDLVLPRWHAVVLVHGCFWHQHSGCPYATVPATRAEFWQQKLSKNQERDARVHDTLLASGWRVAVVWECALRQNVDRTICMLEQWVRSEQQTVEIGHQQKHGS